MPGATGWPARLLSYCSSRGDVPVLDHSATPHSKGPTAYLVCHERQLAQWFTAISRDEEPQECRECSACLHLLLEERWVVWKLHRGRDRF